MPSTRALALSQRSGPLPSNEARLGPGDRWGYLHPLPSQRMLLPLQGLDKLLPRSDSAYSFPFLQGPAHWEDSGRRECPLPIALWGHALALCPQHSPHPTPPHISHQGYLGMGSDWGQISALLLPTKLTSRLELLFLHFPIGDSPPGAPLRWIPGVGFKYNLGRVSTSSRCSRMGGLPCLVSLPGMPAARPVSCLLRRGFLETVCLRRL